MTLSTPWRGGLTLGWQLLDWLEVLPSPRDPAQPLRLTDEQARLVLEWFRVDNRGRQFVYRRGGMRRSKGVGKSPLMAALAILGLAGPVVPDGLDAHGNPVGRPWGTGNLPKAWVQIGAVSEDQTENTHAVVYEFLTANDGQAADALHIDVGLTRSYLRDGARTGKLEPVTASAGSREGQPVTDAVLDETHLWNRRNGGVKLAAALRRNVAKMNGRSIETTNSFIPGEGSVAEATHRAVELGSAGIFYDAVEAPHVDLETCSDDELRAALAVAYGDSVQWVDLDRLVRDARDPDMPREDVERFFLNWNVKGGGKAVDPARWAELADLEREVPPGAHVALGFDGSISDDATILRGCTADGFSFAVGAWVRPADPVAARGWRVPRREVHDRVAWAMDRWHVGRMLCDPPKWWTEIEDWAELYGEDVVVMLDTNSDRRFAPAVDRWRTAIREGGHTHDGDPVATEHILSACIRKASAKAADDDSRTLYTLIKGDDGRKIDAAVADVLAYEAAMTMPAYEPAPERTFFGAWA